MKNGTRPLSTLTSDPEHIAANGSAKKHTSGLRKKILLGSLIASGLMCAAWGLNQWSKEQMRDEYITWVAKYRPAWSNDMIRAQWDKIKYAHEHTDIVEPPNARPQTVVVPTPVYENIPPVRNLTRQQVGPIGPIKQQSLPADYVPDTHGGSL